MGARIFCGETLEHGQEASLWQVAKLIRPSLERTVGARFLGMTADCRLKLVAVFLSDVWKIPVKASRQRAILRPRFSYGYSQ